MNQEVVFQRDFGKNTTKAAKTIKKYGPYKTWKKVEQAAVQKSSEITTRQDL